jgi:hypothetical protein
VFGIIQDLCNEAANLGNPPDPDDSAFLTALGVPRDELDRAYEWEGWTAFLVKRGLALMAAAAKRSPEKLLPARGPGRRQTDAPLSLRRLPLPIDAGPRARHSEGVIISSPRRGRLSEPKS